MPSNNPYEDINLTPAEAEVTQSIPQEISTEEPEGFSNNPYEPIKLPGLPGEPLLDAPSTDYVIPNGVYSHPTPDQYMLRPDEVPKPEDFYAQNPYEAADQMLTNMASDVKETAVQIKNLTGKAMAATEEERRIAIKAMFSERGSPSLYMGKQIFTHAKEPVQSFLELVWRGESMVASMARVMEDSQLEKFDFGQSKFMTPYGVSDVSREEVEKNWDNANKQSYLLGVSMIEAAYGSMAGKVHYYWDDFIAETFPDWPVWQQKTVALALAFTADPANFVLPAGVKVADKLLGIGATKAGKLVAKSPKAKEFFDTMSGGFKHFFVPGGNIPQKLYEDMYYMQQKISGETMDIADFVQLWKNKYGIDEELLNKLSYYAQQKITPDDPKVLEQLTLLKDKFSQQLQDMVDGKVISQDTADLWSERWADQSFVPMFMGGRMEKILKNRTPPTIFDRTKKAGFLKKRKWETFEDVKSVNRDLQQVKEDLDALPTPDMWEERLRDFGLEDLFSAEEKRTRAGLKQAISTHIANHTPDENMLRVWAASQMEVNAARSRVRFWDYLDSPDAAEVGIKKAKVGDRVPEGYRAYYSKGRLRFYLKEYYSPAQMKKLKNELADWAGKLRSGGGRATTTTTTTTSRTTKEATKIAKGAEGGPTKKMEEIMINALETRGMTRGEAETYVYRIKASGNDAEVTDIIDEVTEVIEKKIDRVTESLSVNSSETDMADLQELEGLFRHMNTKASVGVTKNVPVYHMPDNVAEYMEGYQHLIKGDKAAGWFWGAVDNITNVWKMFATTLNPPFHLRNAQTNILQCFMAGMHNPYRFVQAADFRFNEYAIRHGITTADKIAPYKLGERTYTHEQLHNIFKSYGTYGKGWIGSDIQVHALKEIQEVLQKRSLAGKAWNKFDPGNVQKAGRWVGTAIEDNARVALMMDGLSKHGDPRLASKLVRRFLFDYSELTPFEKSHLRRAFPFYTWPRKNLPLQLRLMATKPRKVSAVGKVMRTVGEKETKEQKLMRPGYFDELMYVKSPVSLFGKDDTYFSIDMPILEPNKILQAKAFYYSFNPIVHAVVTAGLVSMGREDAATKKMPVGEKLVKSPGKLVPAPFYFIWALEQKIPNTIKEHDPSLIKTDGRYGNYLIRFLQDKGLVGKMRVRNPDREILGVDPVLLEEINTLFPTLATVARLINPPIDISDGRRSAARMRYASGIGVHAWDKERVEQQKMYIMKTTADNYVSYRINRGERPTPHKMKSSIIPPNTPPELAKELMTQYDNGELDLWSDKEMERIRKGSMWTIEHPKRKYKYGKKEEPSKSEKTAEELIEEDRRELLEKFDRKSMTFEEKMEYNKKLLEKIKNRNKKD